jgi:hypothetical protein
MDFQALHESAQALLQGVVQAVVIATIGGGLAVLVYAIVRR